MFNSIGRFFSSLSYVSGVSQEIKLLEGTEKDAALDGLKSRINKTDTKVLRNLAGNDQLLQFLRTVNQRFVENPSLREEAEIVAYFLMGKVSKEDLTHVLGIEVEDGLLTKEVTDSMHGLLQASSFRFSEDPRNTIAELGYLTEQLELENQFQTQLQNWKNSDHSPDEKRQKAVDEILGARNAGIKMLDLSGLGLTTIPPLPSDITSLNLSNNNLTSLEGLPQKMESLKKLDVSDNAIGDFDKFPTMGSLESLNLSSTNRTELPKQAFLSSPWVAINLCSNPLSKEAIVGIGNGGYEAQIMLNLPHEYKDGRPRTVESVVAEVSRLCGKEVSDPWKKYALTQEGGYLATFLARLPGCESFKGDKRASSINELKAILNRMLTDEHFRELCFSTIYEGNENCHANVQRIFDDLRKLQANPATKVNATLEDVARFQRRMMADRLIDAYMSGPGKAKLISEGIGTSDLLPYGESLKALLSDELSLPIQYGGEIKSNAHKLKNDAKQFVLTHLNDNTLFIQEMIKDPTCVDFLKKCYPTIIKEHEDLWSDLCDDLMSKDGILEGDDFDLDNAGKSAQSMVEQAKGLPAIGTGALLGNLQKIATEDVLTKITSHALDNISATPEDRKKWETKSLYDGIIGIKRIHKHEVKQILPEFKQHP